MATGKTVFEPDSTEELLRGWLLHAHKARDRHDEAARRCERRRVQVGIPAIALAAVAGTSVFASIGMSPEAWVGVVVGSIAILAAALTALQTFLDYPGRAARHHAAGAKYKAIVWELEEALAGPALPEMVDRRWIDDLRARFATLEETAPVVDTSTYAKVEAAYKQATWVGTAVQLSGSAGPSPAGGATPGA
jgi:hypothetical protein